MNPKDKIISKYMEKEGYSLDPMTILAIVGFILNVVEMVKKCYGPNNTEKAVDTMQNPGIVARIILGRMINKFCQENGLNKTTFKDVVLNNDLSKEDLLNLLNEV